MIFRDRAEAGELLGRELSLKNYPNPHVFALVRGGVPIGSEVSKILGAPIDIVVVRKLGLPSFKELGFGAIAPDGTTEIDEMIVDRYKLHVNDIEAVKNIEKTELNRRMKRYQAHEPKNLKNETVILIDDGIATGITMLVATKYLKKFDPKKLIVAVPVCPDTAEAQFRGQIDEFICLNYDENFNAVGEFYESFPQVTDEEVMDYLKQVKSL